MVSDTRPRMTVAPRASCETSDSGLSPAFSTAETLHRIVDDLRPAMISHPVPRRLLPARPRFASGGRVTTRQGRAVSSPAPVRPYPAIRVDGRCQAIHRELAEYGLAEYQCADTGYSPPVSRQ